MKKRFKIALIVLSLFLLKSVGFSQDTVKDFDYGKIENGKYLNSFFNFEITLPANWIVQSKEVTERLASKGKEMMVGDDANMKAVIKASEVNSANLLMAFQFERGAPVDYNPSIVIVSENIKNAPGIKTGSDYLFQAKKLLANSQIKYDYIDTKFKNEVINGTTFYKMNAEIKYLGINIKQCYYSTIINGFSFNIIISYSDKQQKNDLLESLNSMKLGN